MNPKKAERLNTIFGAIGAVVEWYDLMLYGYLATVFAVVFFPDGMGAGVAIAATMGGFAVGFLMRPLGGMFFGWVGDRFGRKASLMLAIMMMGVPMLGTALLPGYAVLGWVAPITLILLRMIMGFSSGGEYSGTLVFLAEGSDKGGRGRKAAVATAFAAIGVLLASMTATLLTWLLTYDQLVSWGWRVPFFLGSLILILGIVMRSKMVENDHYLELKESGQISKRPLRDAMRSKGKMIVYIGLLAGFCGLAYYIVLTYMVTYFETTLGMSSATANLIGTSSALLYAVTAFYFGGLSDRLGRKKQMMIGAIGLAVLSVPLFLMMSNQSALLTWVCATVLLIPVMMFNAAFYPAATELLPARERSAGVGIGYNFGTALLGSTAPFVVQVLLNMTGIATIPAYYLVIAAVLIIPVIMKLPETAFKPLDAGDVVPAQRQEPIDAKVIRGELVSSRAGTRTL